MELKNHPEVHMGLALYLAYKIVVVYLAYKNSSHYLE